MMDAPEFAQEAGQLYLVGHVNFQNAARWRQKGDALLSNQTSPTVAINFSRIGDADTSVLSLMLCWLRLATSLGIKLVYVDVPDHVLRISDLYGIKEMLFSRV